MPSAWLIEDVPVTKDRDVLRAYIADLEKIENPDEAVSEAIRTAKAKLEELRRSSAAA
jgi:phage shock protein A